MMANLFGVKYLGEKKM